MGAWGTSGGFSCSGTTSAERLKRRKRFSFPPRPGKLPMTFEWPRPPLHPLSRLLLPSISHLKTIASMSRLRFVSALASIELQLLQHGRLVGILRLQTACKPCKTGLKATKKGGKHWKNQRNRRNTFENNRCRRSKGRLVTIQGLSQLGTSLLLLLQLASASLWT